MKIYLLAILIVSSCYAATLRVACGGPGGPDTSGNVWQSDISFVGGSTWSSDPGPAPPYYYLRYGLSFYYNFPVSQGNYRIIFRFLEPNKTGPNQRVFKIFVNDILVVPSVDIYNFVGAHTPWDLMIAQISAVDHINIRFVGLIGNAVVSGIQIDDLSFKFLTLDTCQDLSGCIGLYRAKFSLANGSTLSIIGVELDSPKNTWIKYDN